MYSTWYVRQWDDFGLLNHYIKERLGLILWILIQNPAKIKDQDVILKFYDSSRNVLWYYLIYLRLNHSTISITENILENPEIISDIPYEVK